MQFQTLFDSPFPCFWQSTLPLPSGGSLAAELQRLDGLEAFLQWLPTQGCTESPWIVLQDEFSQDVVAQLPEERFLICSTT